MKIKNLQFGQLITGTPLELYDKTMEMTNETGKIYTIKPWIKNSIGSIFIPYDKNNWFYVLTDNTSYYMPFSFNTCNAGVFGDFNHFKSKYENIKV